MRNLIVLSATLIIAACSSSDSTEPMDSQLVINVRVSDDRGVPVDRIPVIVTMSSNRFDGRTRSDGKAGINVVSPGTYTIRVIPRDGYAAGIDPTVKSVSVEANATALVDFMIFRAGNTNTNLPGYENGGW